MKKFFLILFILMLAVGGAVFWAIDHYVSVDKITAQIVEQVKKKTGRDITFGKVRCFPLLTPLPAIMLRLEDVSLSNADWAKSDDAAMLTLGGAELRLAIQPLFHKQIEVIKFTIDHPVIHLDTTADGRKNWEFETEKKKDAEEKTGGGEDGSVINTDALTKDIGFKFSQFELKKGTVTFLDWKKGETLTADNIDATVTWPDLASTLQLDGWAEFRGKRVNVFASVDKPVDLMKGAHSTGSLTVKTDDLKANAKGTFATSGTMLDGNIDTEIADLSKAAAWLGGGAEKPMPFIKVSFASKAQASATALQLQGAKLALDDIDASGDITLGLGGKPDFKARLALSKLNLDRFTGVKPDDSAGGGGGGKKKRAPQDEWDDTPLDFSGLKMVNADLVLNTKGFSLRGAEVGPSTLTVLLKDSNMHFKSSEASLFGGTFLSDLTINAAQAMPSVAFKFGMKDVDAKPVLVTFAHFDNLSGKVSTTVDVTTTGNSQKTLIGNLGGNGTFDFKNGAVTGIDFVNIMSSIQSRLAEMGVGQGKTDFVDMAGTFTVTQGVAHNNDLKMKGPLVQTTGSGDVDLPNKVVNYRALPTLTASSAVEGAGGITVPVDIKGPFNNIKVKPDYKAALTGLLGNPKDAKEAVQNAKTEGKALLKDIKKDPHKALKGLLGILGGRQQPADDAPPPDDGSVAPAQ